MYKRPIGIFGGTFDPIHFGHLRPALEVCETLDLEIVHFVPSKIPVHRTPTAETLENRLQLLRLAIDPVPQFKLDLREVEREEPSWMVLTLKSLREEFPQHPLCLIIGMDAFLQLHTWYQWEQLFDFAHVVVMHRPGFQLQLNQLEKLPKPFIPVFQQRKIEEIQELHQNLAGKIIFQPVTQLDISATQIRELRKKDKSLQFLMPNEVWKTIIQDKLYDSSSRYCFPACHR